MIVIGCTLLAVLVVYLLERWLSAEENEVKSIKITDGKALYEPRKPTLAERDVWHVDSGGPVIVDATPRYIAPTYIAPTYVEPVIIRSEPGPSLSDVIDTGRAISSFFETSATPSYSSYDSSSSYDSPGGGGGDFGGGGASVGDM